jgi:hypothetical protein
MRLTYAGYWYAYFSIPFFSSCSCGGICGWGYGSGFFGAL